MANDQSANDERTTYGERSLDERPTTKEFDELIIIWLMVTNCNAYLKLNENKNEIKSLINETKTGS